MRTWRTTKAILMALVVLVSTSDLVSSEGTTFEIGPADSTPLQPATRLGRFQMTPLPPPPQLCSPGALIRGVDVGTKKVIAFSFDDGPWPRNTADIMASFEARGLRTTFFMIGDNVRRNRDIALSVARRGHEIGNHSMTHQYSSGTIASEVKPANDLIQAVTGVRPTLFRSPGLTEGSRIQASLSAQGMCNIFTNVDFRDWILPRRSSSALCGSFDRSLRPGLIVLLHDGGSHRSTVDAVPCMLDTALARGYRIVTVGELLLEGTPFSGGATPRIQGTRSSAEPITE
jgi:peptidoglycan/xylan/chitin deacetylase (PgdA/CDA1 family)